MDTAEQKLGQRIRKFREYAGLTQSQLAQELGVDATVVSKIESGSRRVSTRELTRLAEVLGVSVLALLDDESPMAGLAHAARTVQDTSAGTSALAQNAQRLCELFLIAS